MSYLAIPVAFEIQDCDRHTKMDALNIVLARDRLRGDTLRGNLEGVVADEKEDARRRMIQLARDYAATFPWESVKLSDIYFTYGLNEINSEGLVWTSGSAAVCRINLRLPEVSRAKLQEP